MQHVTKGFTLFMTETPEMGQAYMEMVKQNAQASSLDKKNAGIGLHCSAFCHPYDWRAKLSRKIGQNIGCHTKRN